MIQNYFYLTLIFQIFYVILHKTVIQRPSGWTVSFSAEMIFIFLARLTKWFMRGFWRYKKIDKIQVENSKFNIREVEKS